MWKLALICFLAAGTSVMSQEKKSCLSETVIAESIGCITKKFEDLLNQTGSAPFLYSAETNRQGRHLQSIDETIGQGPIVGSKSEAIRKFGELHKEIFRDLSAGMLLVKQNFGENFDILKQAEFLKTISHMDFARLKGVYQERIIHDLRDYRHAITRKARAALSHQAGDTWNDLQPLCDLVGIGDFCKCVGKYNETQLEDGVEWVECLYECGDLPEIASCVQETFTNCKDEGLLGNPSWVGNLIVKGFATFAKLDSCYIKVLSSENFEIEEGGPAYNLEMRTFLPPIMQCYDLSRLDTPMGVLLLFAEYASREDNEMWCYPEIQISTSNYIEDIIPFLPDLNLGSPKCRDDRLMEQAVLGWHDHAVNSSCSFPITNSNWNDTFSIPITAVVDGKVDKLYQDKTLTIKLVASGVVRYSTKIKMTVKDKDHENPQTCRSVNDPHMITFDGLYYNNHYEGYFQLYKHTQFPYQVQAIYQKCGVAGNGTCSCAVAVQSGDDVIVVDKCRRTSLKCGAATCDPPTRLSVLLNGELTPGTRIYRRNQGLGLDVLLPHGTFIQVSESVGALNVAIRPSVYDREKTLGLCGVFNENTADDLTMPDGSLYNSTGKTEVADQPEAFNTAWRVPTEENIFQGVLESSNATGSGNYCTCHHVLAAGVQCECGPDMLVQACDMAIGEEITHNISVFAARSWRQLVLDSPDQKMPENDIIMDLSYELKEVSWRNNGTDTEQSATAYCQELMDTDRFLEKCTDSVTGIKVDFLDDYKRGCREDIQLLDSRAFGLSAVQSARAYCQEFMDQRYRWDDVMMGAFSDIDCPNSCNNKGTCDKGVCRCTNSTGPDCGMQLGTEPRLTSTTASLCDSRYINCTHANLYGLNFLPEYRIQCHYTPLTVTETGVTESGRVLTSDAIRVTTGQVACPLQSAGSYRLSLSNTQAADLTDFPSQSLASGSVDFVQFDSTCFNCDVTGMTCKQRTDPNHCLIDGRCLAQNETDPNDSCYVCDPSRSMSKYQYKDDKRPMLYGNRATVAVRDKYAVKLTIKRTDAEGRDNVCAKRVEDQNAQVRERNIRIGAACGLSGAVILGALLLFCITRHRSKQTENSNKTGQVNKGLEDGQIKSPETHTTSFTNGSNVISAEVSNGSLSNGNCTVGPYEVLYDNVPGPEQLQTTPNTKELADFVRLKEAAMEKARSRANSGGSRKSMGIGAAGPIAFGKYARSASELAATEPAVLVVSPAGQPQPSPSQQQLGETGYTNVRL